MPSRIPISDLEAITEVSNSHYLAVDNGTSTNKITVEKFNESASASAASYAQAAANSATAAAGSASSASETASEINNKLNAASTLVSNASTYADNASASASAAANSATAASGSATSAGNSATSAASSVTAAEQKANLAKSWAVGNTGARADEAVNNAKYWSDVAQAAAGGGVTAFNGRYGAVVPGNADYTASMIQYGTDENDDPIYVDDAIDDLYSKEVTDSGNITTLQSDVTALQGKVTVLIGTLAAGSTTLTFTSDKIGANSLINLYSSVDGVVPTAKSVSGTTLTLTFDPQSVAVSIKARIEN